MSKSAYEKMFEDGTAFQPIKIEQPTPNNPGGGMGGGADPDAKVDYSLFDNHMDNMIHEKIEAKKSKVLGEQQPARFTGDLPEQSPIQQGGIDKIARLERRIDLLEKALSLVMETQTKLMRG